MPNGETKSTFTDDEKKECILKLRQLLTENEKLSLLQCDDAYLERYLYSTEFDVNLAFKKIRVFYESLEEKPEWFTTESPLDKEDMIKRDIRILTSNYDKEGHPVYIVPIRNMNSSTMDLLKDVVVVDDFFMELMLANDSNAKNGLCVIIDISNFPWNLLKWLTPRNIKTALKRMYTMPIKEYKFHIVKSSVVINAAINIIWPFLSQNIKDGVKFHFNDFDSLHEYVGPDVLPPEYGGTSKIDYKKSQQRVLDQSKQIAETFRINRELYLQQIEHRF